MVWDTPHGQDEDGDDGMEHDGRLFEFKVSKTKEQEEGITVAPGFKVRLLVFFLQPHADDQMFRSLLPTFLLQGKFQDDLFAWFKARLRGASW